MCALYSEKKNAIYMFSFTVMSSLCFVFNDGRCPAG